MSSRLTNKLLRAVVADEDQIGNNDSKQQKSKKRALTSKGSQRPKTDEKLFITPAEAHLKAILQFDAAIDRYSASGQRALKRKNRKDEETSKERKKIRRDGSLGTVPRLKQEPTFNKRRYKKEKEAKSLRDIAKALKKSRKAKKQK